MRAYRYITGPDDAEFCHRITALLNRGWELHGSATLTFDALRGRVICGQALTKQVEGREYSPDVDLDRL